MSLLNANVQCPNCKGIVKMRVAVGVVSSGVVTPQQIERITNEVPAELADVENMPARQVDTDTGEQCPTHHDARRGNWGLYCPRRMPDGSWCQWQPESARRGQRRRQPSRR